MCGMKIWGKLGRAVVAVVIATGFMSFVAQPAAAESCRSAPSTGVFGSTAVSDGNGTAYVFGGTVNSGASSTPVLAIHAGSSPSVCSLDASVPCPGALTCRFGSASAWDPQQHVVYVFGGVGGGLQDPSASVRIFDPAQNRFTDAPSSSGGALLLPTPRWAMSAAWLPAPAPSDPVVPTLPGLEPPCRRGCAFLFGGMRLPSDSEMGDYQAGRLRDGQDVPDGAFKSDPMPVVLLRGILRFDPEANKIDQPANLPSPLAWSAAVSDGQNAHIFGGLGTAGATRDILTVTPAGQVSVASVALPQPRFGISAVWAERNARDDGCAAGCIYLVDGSTGADGSQARASVLRFDVQGAGSLSRAGSIPGGAAAAAWASSAVWAQGRLLVVGGGTANLTGECPESPTDQLLRLVNRERHSAGRGPLAIATDLQRLADRQSHAMARRRREFHSSGLERKIRGETQVGENVTAAPNVETAHAGWMASSHHRANILNPAFNQVGFAAVKRDANLWLTEVFVARRSTSTVESGHSHAAGFCAPIRLVSFVPVPPSQANNLPPWLIALISIVAVSIGLRIWRRRRTGKSIPTS